MKLLLAFITFALLSTSVKAEEVFRIEIGKDYHRYSQSDLQRRVWELEKAVSQLQARVFQMEAKPQPTNDSWVCTIKAMSDSYMGTGPTKAMATSKAMEKCRQERGDGFFCKDPKCEQ